MPIDLMAGLRALLQQADAEATPSPAVPPASPPAPSEPTPALPSAPEPATPGTPSVAAPVPAGSELQSAPAGITQEQAQAMATAAAEQAAAAVRAEFARASQPTAPVTPPATGPAAILPITPDMTAAQRMAAVDKFMTDNAGKSLVDLGIAETRITP